MRKLALKDEILMQVEKPARYTGGEINAVMKDAEQVAVRFVMCFPDVYEIGMSHLGIQIIYSMLNQFEDVWCERVYSPWVDLDRIMRREHIPLFALESQDPVRDFDFLGITIQYEMCYTNILQILDLSGIPLLSRDREENDPIVIGGGPCTYNPEPICDFFDLFYIGEGETRYRQLLDLYKECRGDGLGRKEFLRRAAQVPGIYVPSLYEVVYREDGTIDHRTALEDGIPMTIEKELVSDVTNTFYPDKPVVPFIKATQDRVVLEIQRGCIRGCRFCQAGQLYRPVRERSTAMLEDYALKMLESTGHEEISLSSLSSSDYSCLPELLDFLIEICDRKKVNISLPSLRIDAFSLDVMNKVQDVKKSSLTFAPEAGSQRLRDIINKGLTREVILEGARLAFTGGWTRVKLYFMLGLPMETEEDIQEIAGLCNDIAAVFYDTVPKEKRTGRVQITASTSFFIPKPFTPFQWARQCTREEFLEKAYLTRTTIARQLNQKSIKYNWHEADLSVLEGILARGDRKLNQAVRKAYEKGCIYDAWSEYFKNDVWMESFAECNIDPAFYITRERGDDEIFPWDFISCGVSRQFLLREWHKAKKGIVTPNCREKCSGCGAARYGTGVCMESRQEKKIPVKPLSHVVDTLRNEDRIKVRIKFSKYGAVRFIGHLDVMRYFQKAVRRADIDIAYSEGFSPHQVMSFAAPLSVGHTSQGEYLDIEVNTFTTETELQNRLQAVMAEGIDILKVQLLPKEEKNAMASVAAASYLVTFRKNVLLPEGWQEGLISFCARKIIPVVKKTKKGEKEINLKESIYDLSIKKGAGKSTEDAWEDGVYMLLNASSGGNIKPAFVLECFFDSISYRLPEFALMIHRVDTYKNIGTEENRKLVPLIWEK